MEGFIMIPEKQSTSLSVLYKAKLNISRNLKTAQRNQQISQSNIENLLANIPAYVDWKNYDSTYLGCSENTALKLAGLKSPKEIIGKLDKNLAWGINDDDANYKTYYLEPDKQVLNGNILISIGRITNSNSHDNKNVIIKKYPLLNSKNDISGIVSYLIDISRLSLPNILAQLKDLGISLTPLIISEAKKYTINKSLQDLRLSKREEECLYHLLRNNTAKEIAKHLSLSHLSLIHI